VAIPFEMYVRDGRAIRDDERLRPLRPPTDGSGYGRVGHRRARSPSLDVTDPTRITELASVRRARRRSPTRGIVGDALYLVTFENG
jgi:hypothetical protein